MILNISADYPDSFVEKKTRAVKMLLDESKNNHFIFSLNRTSNPIRVGVNVFNNRIDIRYFGLPFGVFLRPSLYFLAKKIAFFVKKENLSIDLIVAHKMSVEGVVAYYLSRMLSVNYCFALWGGSDRRIISHKFEMRGLYKKIFERALVVMPATPWIYSYIINLLKAESSKVVFVPIVTENTKLRSSCFVDGRLVTVFNLDLYVLKGLPTLLVSLSKMLRKDWVFDIYGEGSDLAINRIRKLISDLGLDGKVFLKGRIPNNSITDILSGYSGFVMPTTNETYGMVYIEALFAGIPILYSKNQGIDGYFDDVLVGVKVFASDENSIRDGIEYLLSNQVDLKNEISDLHRSGRFEIFVKSNIVSVFDSAIKYAINH